MDVKIEEDAFEKDYTQSICLTDDWAMKLSYLRPSLTAHFQSLNTLLINNINQMRIKNIVINSLYSWRTYPSGLSIFDKSVSNIESYSHFDHNYYTEKIRLLLKNGFYPCLTYDSMQANPYLSLKNIGRIIKNYRNCHENFEETEKALNQILEEIVTVINQYPFNFIEICLKRKKNQKRLELRRISLLNHRSPLITIYFVANQKSQSNALENEENGNNTNSNQRIKNVSEFRIFGLNCCFYDVWTTIIPSPECLVQLFHAGIDIIHLYECQSIDHQSNQTLIIDRNEKIDILCELYKNKSMKKIYNILVPFFLVCSKYQSPFIATYNYLHEYSPLIEGIIRTIIDYVFNESKFEDISYLYSVFSNIIESKKGGNKIMRNDTSNMMNIICEHGLLRIPMMLANFRDWIVREICLSFDKQQMNDLKQHMVEHQMLWNTCLIDLQYDDNWVYFARIYNECGLDIPSNKMYSVLYHLLWSESYSELESLLISNGIQFNFNEVWFQEKTNDCNLGLLWHVFCNVNDNDHQSINQYLQTIHDSEHILWLNIVRSFCEIFFNFYGSLKEEKKVNCMKNAMLMFKIWNQDFSEYNAIDGSTENEESKSDIEDRKKLKKNIGNAYECCLNGQSLWLVGCFNSCNSEIFECLIVENILDVQQIADDIHKNGSQCIIDLFDAFQLKFPLIQIRRYNHMLVLCKYLHSNGCSQALDAVCEQLIAKIDLQYPAVEQQQLKQMEEQYQNSMQEEEQSMDDMIAIQKSGKIKRWRNVIQKLNSLKTEWKAL